MPSPRIADPLDSASPVLCPVSTLLVYWHDTMDTAGTSPDHNPSSLSSPRSGTHEVIRYDRYLDKLTSQHSQLRILILLVVLRTYEYHISRCST